MPGILGTRGAEIDLLCGQADIRKTETHAGIKFFIGTLDGVDIILSCTNAGKIAAAVGTQILFDQFRVDEMILVGPASPLVPYLQQGDLVIGERAWQFDPSRVGEESVDHPVEMNGAVISADDTLVYRVAESYKGLYSHLSNRPQLIAGTIVSDDRGGFSRRVVGLLHRELGVVAVDHEAASVAAVCAMNDKPFVIIRTIVDALADSAPGKEPNGPPPSPEHLTMLVRSALAEPQPAAVRE